MNKKEIRTKLLINEIRPYDMETLLPTGQYGQLYIRHVDNNANKCRESPMCADSVEVWIVPHGVKIKLSHEYLPHPDAIEVSSWTTSNATSTGWTYVGPWCEDFYTLLAHARQIADIFALPLAKQMDDAMLKEKNKKQHTLDNYTPLDETILTVIRKQMTKRLKKLDYSSIARQIDSRDLRCHISSFFDKFLNK